MLTALREDHSEEWIISFHASEAFFRLLFLVSVSGLLAYMEQCRDLWALSQPGHLIFKTPNFRNLV